MALAVKAPADVNRKEGTMLKRPKRPFAYVIRRLQEGGDSDQAERIYDLIAVEAAKEHMLLRPLEEIRKRISAGQVVAAFANENLVGNCFFHPWSRDLVEICSLVVDERFRRQGIGTSLVKKTIFLSLKLYPKAQIFCLTDSSDRPDTAVKEFISAGFRPVKKSALPDEVWEWCETDRCPDWLEGKFPNCKCLAMVYQS